MKKTLSVLLAGDVLRELVDRAAAQVGGILAHGDGVHIHDAVQAVVFVLQAHPTKNHTCASGVSQHSFIFSFALSQNLSNP